MAQTLGGTAETASAPPDAREAARLASLRRFAAVQASPPASSAATSSRVRDAKKNLDRELHAIPDYLHNHPGIILDCINLLLEICGKTKEHVRKGPGEEFKINTAVFERKTHGVAHGYEALLRLGFRPKVIEMKKYAVHEGLFDDKETEISFLDEAASAIEVAKAGVETHVQDSELAMQSYEKDTKKKKEEDEIRRQRALAAFEEDREGVVQRLQRAA